MVSFQNTVTYICIHVYNYIVQSRWTPLHTAARQGHVTVVKTMINLGADADYTDSVRDNIVISMLPTCHKFMSYRIV